MQAIFFREGLTFFSVFGIIVPIGGGAVGFYFERCMRMKKYEYMTVDLSVEPSLNLRGNLEGYVAKLNEYGKDGWRLISGMDDWKYTIFEREVEED